MFPLRLKGRFFILSEKRINFDFCIVNFQSICYNISIIFIMRFSMKRVTKLDRETLKFYARMAAESFVNDPVHCYANKNVERRKKFVYHFLLERSIPKGMD